DWTMLHRRTWARAGRPIAAVEDDTILQFEPFPTHDTVTWFGPAFREFAIAAPDTWPALRRTGIPLTDWWRRTALAWVLQSPALVGTVNAATGETRLYLAPGADSLAAAWAAVLTPLIQPLDSLPAALRNQLPFPDRVFRAATTLVRRWRSDTTTWTARPRDPFALVAPAAEGRGEGGGDAARS